MKNNMKKKLTTTILCVLFISVTALALIACTTKEREIKKEIKTSINIGVTLPLSGDYASYGEDVKRGIELALKDSGFEEKYNLIYEDDQCAPTSTTTNVQKFIGVDNTKYIIGPMCSGSALAAIPIATENNVLMISGSVTSPKLSEYPLFFRTIPSDAYQGEFAAEYMYNILGKKKVAIEYMQSDYGAGLRDSFKKKFIALGGEVVVEQEHAEAATDFRTQIAKIKSSSAEGIYLAAYPIDCGKFLKQSKELGITMPIIAPEAVESADMLNAAGSSAEGLLFTKAKQSDTNVFNHEYKEKYGEDPKAFAAAYYDATRVLVLAIEQCIENVSCTQQKLVDMPAYSGVSGSIDFDNNGDITSTEFVMKTVKNNSFALK